MLCPGQIEERSLSDYPCVGLIGTQLVECYHPRIRAGKDAMLAAMESTAGQV